MHFANIVIDGMSIREQLLYRHGRFYGGVDLGCGATSDNDQQLARNALVFMAFGINGHWKVPVGYFLVNSLTGQERANLLKLCLQLIHQTGIIVHSVTFDGAASNIAMCKILGANFCYGLDFRPYFAHPVTQEKVFVFWDVCHMVKLVRNTLGDKKVLTHRDSSYQIRWSYIEKLYEVQEAEGLRCATKLTKSHIQFGDNRMRVKYATQVLSNSVAKALDMCKILQLPGFFGSETTSKFCSMFDQIFDILNSKNPFALDFCKKPVSQKNLDSLSCEIINVLIIYVI